MNLSIVLAVVIGLALVGAVFELIRTERRKSPAAPPRPAPANVRGREALEVIDLGLRRLADACVGAARAVPDAYAVVYSGERLSLRLTGPDPAAPAPWTADADGEEWDADTSLLGEPSAMGGPVAEQPYALAVTVGLAAGERVLVDLSRASAGIALSGGAAEVQQLVRAFVSELITGPVGRRAEVTLVGSVARTEMAAGMGSARLHMVATLEEGLARGGDGPGTAGGRTGATPAVTQVFRMIEGSGPVTVRDQAPRLFVLDAGQYAEERHALDWLERGDALLVIGETAVAGWRFRVGEDGSLDTGPLGLLIDVHAGRLA
ncbi:hypothetical protein [Streptomyces sp. NPDC091371]|uniref:hypothetical protein n=1 Tax=Streptomyces sp. NPDC091371 TaxID=3155303 RepID=UPI00341CEA71